MLPALPAVCLIHTHARTTPVLRCAMACRLSIKGHSGHHQTGLPAAAARTYPLLSHLASSPLLLHTPTPTARHPLSGLSSVIEGWSPSHDPLLSWHPAWNQTVRMAIIALFAARSPSHVIPVGAGSMLRPRPPPTQAPSARYLTFS